jgi:hypothetical protein
MLTQTSFLAIGGVLVASFLFPLYGVGMLLLMTGITCMSW